MNAVLNAPARTTADMAAAFATSLRREAGRARSPAGSHDALKFEDFSVTGRRPLVYMFDQGASDTRMPELRGGKGSCLAELSALSMPVPPGATITTDVAVVLEKSHDVPFSLATEVIFALGKIEQRSGLVFGSSERPLLLSVRSGAPISMPGMMDTILNIGLTQATLPALAARLGEHAALDCYRRFLAMFGNTALSVPQQCFQDLLGDALADAGVASEQELSCDFLERLCLRYEHLIESMSGRPVPTDPLEQLAMAICAVFASWHSAHATIYRNNESLPDGSGTAVNIQAMVFGNCDNLSGTGVVFSANPATGESADLYGEYLPQAQGEDVVAGVRTPLPLARLAILMPDVYARLSDLVAMLSRHYQDILDIEFTVENGRLYLLQCRSAKRTTAAAAVYAVGQVEAGRWTAEQALASVKSSEVERLRRPVFDEAALALAVTEDGRLLLSGRPASPGSATGELTFSAERANKLFFANRPFILARIDTSPEDLSIMLRAAGLVTANGGVTCHAAVVARAKNIPAVVGCSFKFGGKEDVTALWNGKRWVQEGEIVSLDGIEGRLIAGAVSFAPTAPAGVAPAVITFLTWFDALTAAETVRPVDMSWRNGRHNLNGWLNDFYLSNAMHEQAKGTQVEAQAAVLKNRVEADLASLLTCYLLVTVAHEIKFFCNRSPERADAHTSWSALCERFCVKLPGNTVGFEINRKIVQAVDASDLDEQAQFFYHCTQVFAAVDCWTSGFGGKPWADIAGAAHDYLSGSLPRTAFIDRVFNLRHHGQAMFNNDGMCSINTREPLLTEQLNAKASATTIGALYASLTSIHRCGEAVQSLFESGHQLKLW